MRKFILTSPKFTGSIIFWFNDENILVHYNNDTDLKADGLRWQLNYLPHDLDDLPKLQKKITGTLVEVPSDISFDAFWNTYDKKHNRKRVEPLYKKLDDADKLQAIASIKPYKKYCQSTGRGFADPEKYIGQRYFETDWRGLK